MKSRFLVAALAFALIASCSRQAEEPAPQAATVPARETSENAFVQADNNGGAEAARKASRDELVRQLRDLLEKLKDAKDLPEAFKLAEAIENLGKDVRPDLEAAVASLPELARIAGLRALWTLEGWDPGVNGLLAIVEGQGPSKRVWPPPRYWAPWPARAMKPSCASR